MSRGMRGEEGEDVRERWIFVMVKKVEGMMVVKGKAREGNENERFGHLELWLPFTLYYC